MAPTSASSLFIPALAPVLYQDLVRQTLQEDLGRAGDLTSDAVIPDGVQATATLRAREAGVLAGLPIAVEAFTQLDARLQVQALLSDGQALQAGTDIAVVSGPARSLLAAERTALNFLGHLSGVASATRRLADAVAPYGARITCTRKTMPGLRALQKYAVRVGGGSNHRFGLDDAVLIKDNHIAIAGSLPLAVERARTYVGHMVRIQVEVDTLDQLDEALSLGVEAVLLDNMDLDTLREAVRRIDGRAISEASGGIQPEGVVAVAQTGVNQIALGWLTHSARVLDIGLDAWSAS